ncbi:MAG: ABC transporter substrate-binding protein [Chitinophagales bacterium]
MPPFFKHICVACVVTILVPACKPKQEYSEKTIFKLNLTAPTTSLDPAFASDQPNSWCCNLLYNGLVQLDNKLQIQPCIAERWEISADRKTYTFYLRNDVFFHDDICFAGGEGRKITSSDFVFSFNRLLDPRTAARGDWVFQNITDSINPFVAVNDTILEINLLKPYAPFLQRLCIPYCSVVPREALEKYGKDFRSHPVGTGPFKFLKWKEGELLILHKNENYFETDDNGDQLPYLDAVNISFIANKSTEFLKFMGKELDFVSDIDVSLKDNILTREGKLQPRYASDFTLLKGPYLIVEYFSILMDSSAFIMQNNPLLEKNIRLAINYAFNRQEMLLFLRNNRGIPATSGFVPPSLYADTTNIPQGYTYDPQRAEQLLADADFTNGEELPEITIHTIDQYQDFAVYLKDKLDDIGIKTKIELVDSRRLRQMRVDKETSFFRSSWIADYPDAETYLNLFYSKNGAPPNYTRFSNPAYDVLFEQAIVETDEALRDKLYSKLDSMIIAHAPIVPLFYDEVYRFAQKNISGLDPDALNMLQLKTVKKISDE